MATSDPFECGFDHAHFLCSDIESSERWFVQVLDAVVVERRGDGVNMTVVLRLGGSSILLRAERPGANLVRVPKGSRLIGLDHLGLLVPDVWAAVAELRRRGAEIAMEPTEYRPGTDIAFVAGPDDIRIELVRRDAT